MRKHKGLEMRNSPRSVRVEITERDIEKGEVKEPETCAAAWAIKRALKRDAEVYRGVTYVKSRDGKTWERFKTSSALRLETIVFDRGGRFMPGEYDIHAPPPSMIVGSTLRKPKSQPRKGKQAKLAARRQVIPDVRRKASSKEDK